MSHINQQRRIKYKHYKSTPNFRSCINKKRRPTIQIKTSNNSQKIKPRQHISTSATYPYYQSKYRNNIHKTQQSKLDSSEFRTEGEAKRTTYKSRPDAASAKALHDRRWQNSPARGTPASRLRIIGDVRNRRIWSKRTLRKYL